MSYSTKQSRSASTQTVQANGNPTRQLEVIQDDIKVVCSCGASGVYPKTRRYVRCPAGMPWSCLRQLELSFEPTVAGGFAIGEDDF